jgi:hypothetical protein
MSTTSGQDTKTRAASVVRLLAGSQAQPRVAMRGMSMTPLLKEPMVLKLGPSSGDDRVGDILVFERASELIAHRITKIHGDVVQTCGDAVPWSPEEPERSAIVGKVIAVLASDDDSASRVDTLMFRLRGIYKARFRAARALPFRARVLGLRCVYALPWMRRRPYVALVQAMAAKLHSDTRAFERALDLAEPVAIAATARRHGCSAMLVDAVSTLGARSERAVRLQHILQPVGRSVALRGMATRTQLLALVRVLSTAGISFALLKGAARLYRGDEDATLHASADLDILVPRAQLDAAVDALRAHGYGERAAEDRQRKYRDHHHHAAPLFPSERGSAVELHVALAPPGWLSIPLDWEALERYLTTVDGAAGPVQMLDNAGTALHYAVHAIGLHRLRDIVLLGAIIARLGPHERRALRAAVGAEQTDGIRLGSAALLAARLAGVGWAADGSHEEYLRWVMRREDMPLFLGDRSQLAEGWFAAGRRFTPLTFRLLDPRSRLAAPGDRRKPALLAAAGRTLTGVAAYCYACLMRPAT